jgi:hypothetical protein
VESSAVHQAASRANVPKREARKGQSQPHVSLLTAAKTRFPVIRRQEKVTYTEALGKPRLVLDKKFAMLGIAIGVYWPSIQSTVHQ